MQALLQLKTCFVKKHHTKNIQLRELGISSQPDHLFLLGERSPHKLHKSKAKKQAVRNNLKRSLPQWK